MVSATVHPGTSESAMHHPNEPGIACRSVLRIYNPPDAGELLMSRLSERYLPIASHDRVPSRLPHRGVTPSSSNYCNNRFSLSLLSRSRRPPVILDLLEILPFFLFFLKRRFYEFEGRRSPLLLFFLECLTSRRAYIRIYIFVYIVFG